MHQWKGTFGAVAWNICNLGKFSDVEQSQIVAIAGLSLVGLLAQITSPVLNGKCEVRVKSIILATGDHATLSLPEAIAIPIPLPPPLEQQRFQ